jgi:plasmid stabilization system protein ParE
MARRRGSTALASKPDLEAYIGHDFGPVATAARTRPWFLSLRAGGDTPPRRAYAVRTIRSFNKDIGKGSEAGPSVHRIGLGVRTIPERTCRMPERGTTGTWNRQHTFLKAAGPR